MKLEETRYDNAETGCCARLDTKRWDGQEYVWEEKLFLKGRIYSFMHIPLNFGSVMQRSHAAAQHAQAYPEEPFWLTYERSPWGADMYLAVDRAIDGAVLEKLSGTFLTKVFEGPYHHAGKWAREMEAYVTGKGHAVKKLFFYYAYCPKCAKRYGKNQVALLAQLQ